MLRSENDEKPNNDGACCVVADQNPEDGHAHEGNGQAAVCEHCGGNETPDQLGDGGDRAGLSWRAVDQLAREVEDWAVEHRKDSDLNDKLEREIRRRLTGIVLPENIEIEAERVIQCLFEGREARRAH